MDKKAQRGLNKIINLSDRLKPKTYLDEFAELGLLDIYINDYLKDKFEKDPDFRERIYTALYDYDKDVNPDVEIFFMEKLCSSLQFFLEYTKECRIQKQ